MYDIEAQRERIDCTGAGKSEKQTPPSPTNTTSSNGSRTPLFKRILSNAFERLNPKWVQKIHIRVPAALRGWPSDAEVNVRKLEDNPDGYPRLAAFLDSDENFMVYRRFGYLQSRLILDKQNELQRLEKDLEECDFEDLEKDPNSLASGDLTGLYGNEDPSERKKLMKVLETKFTEYSSLLASAHQLMSLQRPSEKDYASVRNYLDDERPLFQGEQAWIKCKEDTVTLRAGREHAWLDDAIEHFLRMVHCRFIEFIFCSEETRRKTDGPTVYYTRSRIDRLVLMIITMMILLLLVVPIYVLYHLTNDFAQEPRTTAIIIGVLLVFTLAFSAVLSLFTRARRHEVLAAAAA